MSGTVEETGGDTGRRRQAVAVCSGPTVGMAIGTAVSRLTGVGRILVLAYALGFHHLADAYNLANTTPNMLYDIVLGGVLSATFIPVFVDRLTTRSNREAWRAISAVVTLALAVLVAASVVFWLLAPLVIDAVHGVRAHLWHLAGRPWPRRDRWRPTSCGGSSPRSSSTASSA